MRRFTVLLPSLTMGLLALPSTAQAAGQMSSSAGFWYVDHGDCGTWVNPDTGDGFQITDPYSYSTSPGVGDIDLTYADQQFMQITMEFDQSSTSYFYEANDADGVCDWTVDTESYGGLAITRLRTCGP